MIGIALTSAILVQLARGRVFAATHDHILPDRRAALRIGAVLAALTMAAALVEPLGFRLTMLLFTASVLPILGARFPPAIALTSFAGSFGVFHVFYHWLKVPLPIGVLGF